MGRGRGEMGSGRVPGGVLVGVGRGAGVGEQVHIVDPSPLPALPQEGSWDWSRARNGIRPSGPPGTVFRPVAVPRLPPHRLFALRWAGVYGCAGGTHPPMATGGMTDGQTKPDWVWAWQLQRLFDATSLQPTLMEVLEPLAAFHAQSIDWDLLQSVVGETRSQWRSKGKLRSLGVPDSFEEFALAIHVYTLQEPSIYEVLNQVMFRPDRRVQAGGISEALQACAPYIRFLNEALQRLPEHFVHRGRVYRGVKWVFPSPEQHDPVAYFKAGATILWYEFKSTSSRNEVMSRLNFCGHQAGPRTIFSVDAVRGYRIADFSVFDDEEEVLFPPLTKLRVTAATKLIIDPRERRPGELALSGFPDNIIVEQIVNSPAVPLSLPRWAMGGPAVGHVPGGSPSPPEPSPHFPCSMTACKAMSFGSSSGSRPVGLNPQTEPPPQT